MRNELRPGLSERSPGALMSTCEAKNVDIVVEMEEMEGGTRVPKVQNGGLRRTSRQGVRARVL